MYLSSSYRAALISAALINIDVEKFLNNNERIFVTTIRSNLGQLSLLAGLHYVLLKAATDAERDVTTRSALAFLSHAAAGTYMGSGPMLSMLPVLGAVWPTLHDIAAASAEIEAPYDTDDNIYLMWLTEIREKGTLSYQNDARQAKLFQSRADYNMAVQEVADQIRVESIPNVRQDGNKDGKVLPFTDSTGKPTVIQSPSRTKSLLDSL